MRNTSEDEHRMRDAPDSLTVLSGRQRGARAALPRGRDSLLGTAPDSDIVLRTGEAEPLALSVRCHAEGCTLRAVAGVVHVGDDTLQAGQETEVAYGVPVLAGSTSFAFERGAGHESTAPEAARTASSRAPGRKVPLSMTLATLGCLCGGVLLLTFGAAVVQSRGDADFETPPSLRQRLQAAGFDRLSVDDAGAGTTVRVSGIVGSRQDASRLRRLVESSGTDFALDLQVDAELREAIEDVYRVNGIAADVRITGEGRARASTMTSRADLLGKIEEAVRRDVPALLELERDNVSPPAVVAEDGPAARQDADKTITLVVAGANGYVMTRDLARYFVGSTLPSGHVVKEIAQGQVLVSKGGKDTTLEF